MFTKPQTLTLIAVLLAVSLAGAVPAAGQQTNETTNASAAAPSAPGGAPDEVRIVVDDDVAIVDWSHANGEYTIRVYSADNTVLDLWYESGADGNEGNIATRSVPVRGGTTTVVTLDTSNRVTMFTDASLENGNAYFIEKEGGGLLPGGPYGGTDVRNAGIGGAVGVALAVLWEAMRAKLGAGETGERVA